MQSPPSGALTPPTEQPEPPSEPPVFFWRHVSSRINETFVTYPFEGGVWYATASWDPRPTEYNEITTIIPFTELSGFLAAERPFPETPPADEGWGMDTSIASFGYPHDYDAGLDAARYWLCLSAPYPVPVQRPISVTTRRILNQGEDITYETRAEILTIAAGQTVSNPLDLRPSFTIPTAPTPRHERIDVSFLPVGIQARAGKINDGFDPPLSGDVDLNEVRDEDDWVPWTRVAKSGCLKSMN